MLFCVLGNSGVGKDTVIEEVIFRAKKEMGLEVKKLPMYTTRPPRPAELADPSMYYNFVTEDEFREISSDFEFMEYRSYTALRGLESVLWHYGTRTEDVKKALTSKDFYIVTCTPSMFTSYYNNIRYSNSLHKYTEKLYPIYITTKSEKERLLRMIKRVKSDDELCEVCRRFSSDPERISDDTVPACFSVINEDVSDTVSYILNLFETFLEDDPMDSWKIDCTCPDTFGGLLQL